MARRQVLTLSVIEAVEKEVLLGHWPHVVAKKLGIHKTIWTNWMDAGEKHHLADTANSPKDGDDYLYRQLYERIEEAEASAELDALRMLKQCAEAGKTSWNGYLNFLERRFPDRWRKREAALGAMDETWDSIAKKCQEQLDTRT